MTARCGTGYINKLEKIAWYNFFIAGNFDDHTSIIPKLGFFMDGRWGGVINSLVSPKFPHVPLGIGGCPLGYDERRCWANCPCN